MVEEGYKECPECHQLTIPIGMKHRTHCIDCIGVKWFGFTLEQVIILKSKVDLQDYVIDHPIQKGITYITDDVKTNILRIFPKVVGLLPLECTHDRAIWLLPDGRYTGKKIESHVDIRGLLRDEDYYLRNIIPEDDTFDNDCLKIWFNTQLGIVRLRSANPVSPVGSNMEKIVFYITTSFYDNLTKVQFEAINRWIKSHVSSGRTYQLNQEVGDYYGNITMNIYRSDNITDIVQEYKIGLIQGLYSRERQKLETDFIEKE
jgi:hypothetical protein